MSKPDTTETLNRKFQRRGRDPIVLREKARQARGAAARWEKLSNAYARGGEFHEADDAMDEAQALWALADDSIEEARSWRRAS